MPAPPRGPEFNSLLRRELPRLYAVVLRLIGDPELARDVLQDAVLHAYRKLDTFEGRSQLSTWVHRVIVNQALAARRSRRRSPERAIEELLPNFDEHDKRVDPALPAPPPVEQLVEQAELRQAVHAAVDQLPEDYRAVLLLRDIEGFSTAEVADILMISVANVRTRLHRARAALKRLLEPIIGEIA